MASRGTVVQEIKIERLGQVMTWKLRSEPFKGQQRRVYEAGFMQRTRDWNQGIEPLGAPHFRNELLTLAWEQGYRDAAKQEPFVA